MVALITEELSLLNRPDWEEDARVCLLYSLALGLQAQLIYEWGVGVSTMVFLRAVQRTGGEVVSCDWNEEHSWGLLIEAMAQAGLPWTWHRMEVHKFLAQMTRVADLVHIDGTHSYSSVASEVELAWPLLRDDGLLVLHDTRTFAGGPDVVARQIAALGIEMCELPYSCGLAVIHKQHSDPRMLHLGGG